MTIIMMVDAALGQLKDLGYEREFDEIEIVENDGFPFIEFQGVKIFEVVFAADPSRGLSIKGEWVRDLPPKKRVLWLIKSYRWIKRRLGLVRSARR